MKWFKIWKSIHTQKKKEKYEAWLVSYIFFVKILRRQILVDVVDGLVLNLVVVLEDVVRVEQDHIFLLFETMSHDFDFDVRLF